MNNIYNHTIFDNTEKKLLFIEEELNKKGIDPIALYVYTNEYNKDYLVCETNEDEVSFPLHEFIAVELGYIIFYISHSMKNKRYK